METTNFYNGIVKILGPKPELPDSDCDDSETDLLNRKLATLYKVRPNNNTNSDNLKTCIYLA